MATLRKLCVTGLLLNAGLTVGYYAAMAWAAVMRRLYLSAGSWEARG